MDQKTIAIIHDLLVSFEGGGRDHGQIIAFHDMISGFKSLNLQKQRFVIDRLTRIKSDMEERMGIVEEQMAALQSEDKEIHLFLNKIYKNHIKELRNGIALIDGFL